MTVTTITTIVILHHEYMLAMAQALLEMRSQTVTSQECIQVKRSGVKLQAPHILS